MNAFGSREETREPRRLALTCTETSQRPGQDETGDAGAATQQAHLTLVQHFPNSPIRLHFVRREFSYFDLPDQEVKFSSCLNTPHIACIKKLNSALPSTL